MKRGRWIPALLLVGLACACGADTPSVKVEESGSARSNDFIVVAARVRVDPETLGPIRLRVTFRDNDGARRDETNDTLPYCPVRTDCWWAASFPVDQFNGSKAIRTADVQALGTPRRHAGEARVLPFDVSRRANGRIHGRAPGNEGYVYLVGFDDGEVRGGVSSSITPEDQRNVYFTAPVVAALGRNAELRAYFYPGRVERGD